MVVVLVLLVLVVLVVLVLLVVVRVLGVPQGPFLTLPKGLRRCWPRQCSFPSPPSPKGFSVVV